MNRHEAVKIFSVASAEQPASVTAQAAAIAKHCLTHQVPLDELRSHVLSDEALQLITEAAAAAHTSHGVYTHEKQVYSPPSSEVKEIVRHDMELARRMLRVFSVGELEAVLALKPSNSKEEQEYRSMVEMMMGRGSSIY